MNDRDTRRSTFGRTTRLVGKIRGGGALTIQGRVRGDVVLSGALEISEGAALDGNLEVGTLRIDGSLRGDALVGGPTAIGRGAIVHGSLRATRLSVEPGARVDVVVQTDPDLASQRTPSGGHRAT